MVLGGSDGGRARDEKPTMQAEGPSSGAVGLAIREVVPAHLLDGGEEVILAVKPSAWFVVFSSVRWLVFALFLMVLASTELAPRGYRWYLWQAGLWVIEARLGLATLEWVSRLYVLTNRRVMRIRGVFDVDLFECALCRIQTTSVSATLWERVARAGTVRFQVGELDNGASWRTVSKPLEVHEKLRTAIRRAQNRGEHV